MGVIDMSGHSGDGGGEGVYTDAIRDSDQLYRSLVETSEDMIAVVDERGAVIMANGRAAELLGYPDVSFLLGRNVFEFIHPGDRERARDNIARRLSLEAPQGRHTEYTLVRQDGATLPAEVNSLVITDDEGAVTGLGIVARDITERKHVENELVLVNDLLSAAAHDLKNPLTTIKGFTQMLQRRAQRAPTLDSSQTLDSLERIDTTATRMTQLINELRDVARIRRGQQLELDRRPTDLVELARQEIAEHQEPTDLHRLVLESEPDELVGSWDRFRLERVLDNLLSNAVKYTPKGGDITVRIAQEGEWAVLSVCDPGLGIPVTDLPHIFDSFHRASNVPPRIGGAGIGLLGVKQIVEQHGGTVSVESDEGQGTAFTVRLPVGEALGVSR
jgi:two-component system phosphate regulon sensor histidine kinase PhoR